ncbi:hypothetical protein COOONC_21447 [Cooperia oncophora]
MPSTRATLLAKSVENDVRVWTDHGTITGSRIIDRLSNLCHTGAFGLEYPGRINKDTIARSQALCSILFCAKRRLRYDRPQSIIVTKTPTPPGSQVNDQVVSGSWPDQWWSWLLAGAEAALPEVLAGN